MRKPSRSLVGRLILAFLLPSIAILVVVTILSYLSQRSTLQQAVIERLEGVATAKQAALDTWVHHIFQDIIAFSMLPQLGELSAALHLARAPAERDLAYQRLSRFLLPVAAHSSSVIDLFILADGRIIISTNKKEEGQYRVYERYYLEGKRAPFIQDIYFSPTTLQPALTLSAPIPMTSVDGEAVDTHVLVANLSLEFLDRNIMQQTGLGKSGVVTLVDQNRILMTGRESRRQDGASSHALLEVTQRKSGSALYVDHRGVAVIGVYRWIDERRLGLVVEISQKEAFRPARRLMFYVLSTGLLFVTLLSGVIYLLARRIAQPILTINRAAAKVREGDLQARATVATDDEIGLLAMTFNQMVDQLRDLYSEMAEKIALLEQSEQTRQRLIEDLEAKNAELERFTYTVSHDLKSPLVTIKGFLGLLERDLEKGNRERIADDFRRIASAADKMQELLGELLELSRIGRVVHEPELFPFAQVAREAVESVIGQHQQATAEIVFADPLPPVFGDRLRIRELIENLIVNALKFMGDQPSPRIEIGARRDGEETVLFVKDNGIGIEPAHQDRIFGLFERLDPAIEGTGIGLAIVRRIVEVHGGSVWVESQGAGHGSTLCFTLPERAPATAAAEDP